MSHVSKERFLLQPTRSVQSFLTIFLYVRNGKILATVRPKMSTLKQSRGFAMGKVIGIIVQQPAWFSMRIAWQ